LGHIRADATTVVLALIELLKDKDEEVRLAAAEALGNIGPNAKAAIPALTTLRKDNDEDVRKAAAEALEKIKKEKKQGSGPSK
jgi:HEAT repeat protein